MREKLAKYAHTAWSSYMKYLFNKLEETDNGDLIIPQEYVNNLWNLIHAKYDDLSEEQKGYDREEADKILEIVLKIAVKDGSLYIDGIPAKF